jgi:transposase
MSKHNLKNDVAVLGIDLAKQSFQLHGVNNDGISVLKKKLARKDLCAFIAQLPVCIIGIEACSGANYWVRTFEKLGHTVHMIAPQFVKPFVKSNKNDAADAEAICEAVQRPSMRFVPAKSIEQQDIQSLHRIRSQAVARRTAQANQIRGLLMEYGLIMPQGIS